MEQAGELKEWERRQNPICEKMQDMEQPIQRIKKALEEKRIEYKNKRITQITAAIRQIIRKGDTRKVWQRLSEMKQKGGATQGGGMPLKTKRGNKDRA